MKRKTRNKMADIITMALLLIPLVMIFITLYQNSIIFLGESDIGFMICVVYLWVVLYACSVVYHKTGFFDKMKEV